MEKVIKKTNRATLVAAALIITGTTAVFGTYAAGDEQLPPNGPGPLACYQMMDKLSDEQKTKLGEAHELMQAGDIEAARAIMEELGIRGPGPRFPELTEEQRAGMEKARELFQAGDKDGAKAILDELGIERPEGHPGKGFRKGFQKRFGLWKNTD